MPRDDDKDRDDDRPRSRTRREAEFEDRPRRNREDEDYEERPKKSSSSALIVFLLLGGLVLVAGIVVVVFVTGFFMYTADVKKAPDAKIAAPASADQDFQVNEKTTITTPGAASNKEKTKKSATVNNLVILSKLKKGIAAGGSHSLQVDYGIADSEGIAGAKLFLVAQFKSGKAEMRFSPGTKISDTVHFDRFGGTGGFAGETQVWIEKETPEGFRERVSNIVSAY